VRKVLVVLLPKPGGQDTRPIGLYPALYLLWAKARSSHLKAWQRDGPPGTDTNNMQSGRRTANAVWRVRQAAAGEETPTIEVLWDLRKCYEHVQHELVLQEAKSRGYPTTLLRVSLSSYRWTMGTIVGRGVVADRGIIAGSSHATFEIAMLVQRQMAAVALANQVLASIHIDDLSVTISRPNKVETAQATKVTAAECKTMFDDMGVPLADDKAQWIASSAAVHDVARRMLGSTLERGLYSARRLGLDHSLRQTAVKGARPSVSKEKRRSWFVANFSND
jgi:hypothetical protein